MRFIMVLRISGRAAKHMQIMSLFLQPHSCIREDVLIQDSMRF